MRRQDRCPGAAGPAGVVTPAAAVADATSEADVVTQFNLLLANLRAAGLLADRTGGAFRTRRASSADRALGARRASGTDRTGRASGAR